LEFPDARLRGVGFSRAFVDLCFLSAGACGETGRANAAAEAKARDIADRTQSAGEKSQDGKPAGQLAALSPLEQAGEMAAKSDTPAAAEIPRLPQAELRRVGCNTGAIDGNWNVAAQRSLGLFTRRPNEIRREGRQSRCPRRCPQQACSHLSPDLRAWLQG
jgi:hypothetical protein